LWHRRRVRRHRADQPLQTVVGVGHLFTPIGNSCYKGRAVILSASRPYGRLDPLKAGPAGRGPAPRVLVSLLLVHHVPHGLIAYKVADVLLEHCDSSRIRSWRIA